MDYFAPPVERLIEEFARLPGIGQKTAQRLAFHVLTLPREDADRFADAIRDAKAKTFTCKRCQNLTDSELCPICANAARDQKTVCVVADPRDVIAFERTKEYKGLYHVLHGTLSPLNHIGPDDIRIRELIQRVADEDIEEVILATNPDTEGEATAMYISRILSPFELKITRLAYGIPVGGHLEFVDEVTLTRALEGRQEL
ncbi:recombination mediator RecR [Agathobaculum sp.]|uniref:recombination mediator RecR n=1 Tax=Agathobaculum sp. TaxID=2048138 RepID=UPI002A82D02A|nr:recombination mediator RecR [Agathobaculum sp.]MDY3618256.1 recombination mediator RecR [Agathobaculum sp.]